MTRSTIPAYVDHAASIVSLTRAADEKTETNKAHALGRIGQVQAIIRPALDRMIDALPGAVGSRAPDAEGGGPTLDELGHPMPRISDPTGEAAIRPDIASADRAVIAEATRELVKAVRAFADDPTPHTAHTVETVAGLLLSFAERWAPRHAHDGDRARGDDVPLCESCARLTDHRNRPLAEPAERNKGRYQRRTITGTPRWLCAPCGNFAKANERMPTKDELARFRDTGRWRIRAALLDTTLESAVENL